MINLTKKQKVLIIVGVIIMIMVIGYYFYQNFEEAGYDEIEENISESKDKEGENEGEILIHITGAVREEGVVRLKEGARVIDAIEESGGLLEDANLSKVNLAYPLVDGQKVYIPSINDEETENEIVSETENGIVQDTIDNLNQNTSKININTAMQTELEGLPGIGTSTAYSIVQYRKENGIFKQIEDIKNVSGIGDAKFNKIKDFICVK